MKKEFSLSNDKAMMNFTVKYCDTMEKLLESDGFRRVIKSYLYKVKNRNSNVNKFIEESLYYEGDTLVEKFIELFKLLSIMKKEEVVKLNKEYIKILEDKDNFIGFIEDLYGFWRRLERYTIVNHNALNEGIASVSFIDANENFTNIILGLYRKIEESVLGIAPKVYRQLPVGGNAGIILNDVEWKCPEEYEMLEGIPFIDTITLETPYITYPKKNTRDGMFSEVYSNPLDTSVINKNHFFCYPAKVGELLAFIYFHRDFMAHGVTLCNLFELARLDEYKNRKPDIIYVYGAKDISGSILTNFYDDFKNEIMVGYVSYGEAIDYFGYMKKMTLTLHNLIMIKRGYLPIHGAMVNIVMKNGNKANVVIVGDSGAGKSESLEALRSLSENYISDMTIVFDDMGVLKIDNNGDVLGYGTEIGAFVRLDDLDQGYAFKEIDRSIFMNPDKTNARLVMPVSTYKEITRGYKIDLFLYANNYEKVESNMKTIEYFETPEDSIRVFKAGARMAKGTTTEKGLVESYFANPFGPAQKQKETNILMEKYFNIMYEKKIRVGQIKTSLAIEGMEKEGPKNAAIELFDIIKSV